MTDRATMDLEECPECKARFPVDEVKLPDSSDEVDDLRDMDTQFGWLSGQCPRCGADLRFSYDRLRIQFAPPQ